MDHWTEDFLLQSGQPHSDSRESVSHLCYSTQAADGDLPSSYLYKRGVHTSAVTGASHREDKTRILRPGSWEQAVSFCTHIKDRGSARSEVRIFMASKIDTSYTSTPLYTVHNLLGLVVCGLSVQETIEVCAPYWWFSFSQVSSLLLSSDS